MFSPVIALVCTKYIFRYWAHLLTSSKLTLISISFLAPSNIKRAFGALFLAIPYHILLILSQLFSFPKSKTSTTPSHDLKYVATIDLNFSWPAVSQIHNLTYLSWTWMALYLKSMVVMRWSRGAQFLMYLQKMEVFPVPASPTRMILYLVYVLKQVSQDICWSKVILLELMLPENSKPKLARSTQYLLKLSTNQILRGRNFGKDLGQIIVISLKTGQHLPMAELDEYKQNITANLITLEDLIQRSPLFNTDQIKWRKQIDKLVSQIRRENLMLEDGIKDIAQSQRQQYVGSVRSFKTKLTKLQRQLDQRQRGQSYLGDQKRTIIKTAEEKNKSARQEMLFQQGDEAQETTMNSVRAMIGITEKGQQLANEINLELTAQIEQLDRMNQKTEDTRSTLKKAQKNITYFVKALECDKCMIGLLLLILLALVAVIVLAVKKGQK